MHKCNRRAAFEEAEHAAKFAELLGEELEPSMTADTKKNLAWRVDCEFGAPRASSTWPPAPRRTTWTPSTTPCMRWPATRPGMARR